MCFLKELDPPSPYKALEPCGSIQADSTLNDASFCSPNE